MLSQRKHAWFLSDQNIFIFPAKNGRNGLDYYCDQYTYMKALDTIITLDSYLIFKTPVSTFMESKGLQKKFRKLLNASCETSRRLEFVNVIQAL